MARKTQTIVQIEYYDDLSGSALSEDEVHTVNFGWNGSAYEIDLSKANADKLEKILKPYVDAGRRVSGGRGRPKGSANHSRTGSGSGRGPEELAIIRAWLRKKGHEVSDRGRIKAELVELYDQAHAAK